MALKISLKKSCAQLWTCKIYIKKINESYINGQESNLKVLFYHQAPAINKLYFIYSRTIDYLRMI